MDGEAAVSRLIDGLFRREAGRIVASLVRRLGPTHLDLIEDSVQEAMVRAVHLWPIRGVPENPTGWLTQVARNAAFDRLRQSVFQTDLHEGVASRSETGDPTIEEALELLARCCHPALPLESQAALVLKTLCGFSTKEVARAFLVSETTAAQRVVRAKRRFADADPGFASTGDEELESRLDSVLRCLYLVFNEGYSATEGEDLIRRDLCDDAIRLTRWLALSRYSRPKLHALLALMLFLRSRFEARVEDGALVPLSEQNWERWDARMVGEAFVHFAASAEGDEETEFHLQAAIAAEHAIARDSEPDWRRILLLYERLEASPVVALNAAIARGMALGPSEGLRALEPLDAMLVGHLLFAARAHWYGELGLSDEARTHYKRALAMAGSEPERGYLRQKIAQLDMQTASERSRSLGREV